jgi:methylenetetrahydrofolate--tRNA-(uracil-5-)-methyltransferase
MVNIIGAGLAGCEAAYYLANLGVKVKLYEMRPVKMTPAHKTSKFGELVCSNSLRSDMIDVASGALKQEMEMFNSLVIQAARKTKVEAGSALAVSREDFSQYITDVIKNHENIEVIYGEVTDIDLNEYTIIASGPLTSNPLCEFIKKEFGMDDFYFFDAQAPIIKYESINMDIAYLKSRYDKGEASYINCPMNEEQFNLFYNELINARSAELHDFDCDLKVFEGCMPVEVMAKRGRQTLLFGPLKPKGLSREGYEKPYAVVQLRQDDAEKTLYNLVGFQTHLAFPEQKRVFSLIP